MDSGKQNSGVPLGSDRFSGPNSASLESALARNPVADRHQSPHPHQSTISRHICFERAEAVLVNRQVVTAHP